jgi:RNA polymerase sigma-70 factor (ECF subfamily)
MTSPVVTPTDDELITLVYQKSEDHKQQSDAFAALYDRYDEGVSRRLLSIVHSEATAQDLLQETFLAVWLHARQWNGQGAFCAWLYRIATNLAFNWLRSLRRHPEQPLVMPDEGAWDAWSDDDEPIAPGWLVDEMTLSPQRAFETSERAARLAGLINTLPAEKREVIRLVHEMELSIRDTAEQLNVPEGTVKSRLHYAEKKLRQEWQQE